MRLNIGVCHSLICISIDASLLIINIWNIYFTVFIVLLVVLVYVFVKLAYFYLLHLQFVFLKTFHNSFLLHLWKVLHLLTFNWSISSCAKSSFVRDFALNEFILDKFLGILVSLGIDKCFIFLDVCELLLVIDVCSQTPAAYHTGALKQIRKRFFIPIYMAHIFFF